MLYFPSDLNRTTVPFWLKLQRLYIMMSKSGFLSIRSKVQYPTKSDLLISFSCPKETRATKKAIMVIDFRIVQLKQESFQLKHNGLAMRSAELENHRFSGKHLAKVYVLFLSFLKY